MKKRSRRISTDRMPPVEVYTPKRIAEFLLMNAVSREDYEMAVEEVRRLGIDPDSISHDRPEWFQPLTSNV